jgi:hypothetical protein
MAKPIEPTPILRGKDAERFFEAMEKEDISPNPVRLKAIREGMSFYKTLSRNK